MQKYFPKVDHQLSKWIINANELSNNVACPKNKASFKKNLWSDLVR